MLHSESADFCCFSSRALFRNWNGQKSTISLMHTWYGGPGRENANPKSKILYFSVLDEILILKFSAVRKLIWLLDINADLSLFIFSVSGRFIQSFFLVQNCYLSEGALLCTMCLPTCNRGTQSLHTKGHCSSKVWKSKLREYEEKLWSHPLSQKYAFYSLYWSMGKWFCIKSLTGRSTKEVEILKFFSFRNVLGLTLSREIMPQ